GVVVTDIAPGTPAEKAGLKDGDVILQLNGKKVSEPSALQLLIAEAGPGSKATLRGLREQGNGKSAEKTFTVRLPELPTEALSETGRGGPRGERQESGVDALDGVQVTDLDGRMRRRLELPNIFMASWS